MDCPHYNLRRFKLIYSSQYIQIIPQLNTFHTQILINKRISQIVFYSIHKQYEFTGQFETKYASLLLGVVEIENDKFVVFVEEVYPQCPIAPSGAGIYQIASIGVLEFGIFVSGRQKYVVEAMKSEIFNFGFYFSFERDLTLSLQQLNDKTKTVGSEEMYFWNLRMLKTMMANELVTYWLIPVIQGHYGTFYICLNHHCVQYHLISRRSKYRSGTRYYNRGIDYNSKCSHFIYTEQIIVMLGQVTSYVIVSGSVPIFWYQKSQSDKIKLTRNKYLTAIPFVTHFETLCASFGKVLAINLLEKKKDSENLLLQAYEQLFAEKSQQLQDYCRYYYFDLNNAYKKKNYSYVLAAITKMDPLIKYFGYYRREVTPYPQTNLYPQQRGIFRVSCLDCLWRTNTFLQAICFYTFHYQLVYNSIIYYNNSSEMIRGLLFGADSDLPSLILQFKNVWQYKADFESMMYTGSRATNSKKNKFLDDLESSLISLQRLYNQKFIDRMKQKALDIILHHRNYRFETVLISGDKKSLQLAIVTWNVNAQYPENLSGLVTLIGKCYNAYLIVVGIQEMIELNTNNLVNANEEYYSEQSAKWLKEVYRLLQLQSEKVIFVQKIEMIGLMMLVFVRYSWKQAIKSVQKDTVKTGMGGQFGNKGSVVIRVNIYQTSLCFICSHLAAGSGKKKERIEDFLTIHKKAFQQNKLGVQNYKYIEFSDIKFFFGDLNFRVDGEFKYIKELVDYALKNRSTAEQAIEQLLQKYYLSYLRKNANSPYLLTNYSYPYINFLPTYKLYKTTGNYTTYKSRSPSWCDRILFWTSYSYDDCKCLVYSDIPIIGSDHRPVYAKFYLTVQQYTTEDTPIVSEADLLS